jgi:hypothetical protein
MGQAADRACANRCRGLAVHSQELDPDRDLPGDAILLLKMSPPFSGGGTLHRTPHVNSGSGNALPKKFSPNVGNWMDAVEPRQEFQRADQQF